MSNRVQRYHGYRFPPEIISHAVWLYYRFCPSFRDVEDLLAERGIIVSYETVRQWCRKFGPEYAGNLRRRRGRLGDTWYLDELFVSIQGKRHYLWRAVDQDGDVIGSTTSRCPSRQALLSQVAEGAERAPQADYGQAEELRCSAQGRHAVSRP